LGYVSGIDEKEAEAFLKQQEENHVFQYKCLITVAVSSITAFVALMIAIACPPAALAAEIVAVISTTAGVTAFGLFAKSRQDNRDEPNSLLNNLSFLV